MPIQLEMRWDLSMNDLLAYHRSGELVFKTPHVGNWYLNNLACGCLGIPMKVVDATKGCLDQNFHPHCVIVRGQREKIAEEDVLTSHAMVTQMPSMAADHFAIGESSAIAHMRALKKAIPTVQAQTVTEYVHRHTEEVMQLLEVITKEDRLIWQRFVQTDGHTTTQKFCQSWSSIVQAGVVGTNASRAGWVTPNLANILMDVTIDPKAYKTDRVYSLSGPDMYRYIKQMMPKLNRFYDVVRATLDWQLPETMQLHIVPVADMRFVVPSAQRQALDELVDMIRSNQTFEQGIGRRMKTSVHPSAEISQIQQERRDQHVQLREAMYACPEPFYEIKEGNFMSQYDLLDLNENLYLHPWALQTPMGTLKEVVAMLRRLL